MVQARMLEAEVLKTNQLQQQVTEEKRKCETAHEKYHEEGGRTLELVEDERRLTD
jgi:hypothetical protein